MNNELLINSVINNVESTLLTVDRNTGNTDFNGEVNVSGSVGIGTNAQQEMLDVVSNTTTTAIIGTTANSTESARLLLVEQYGPTTQDGIAFDYDGVNNELLINSVINNVENTLLTVERDTGNTIFNGAIGIQNPAPNVELDVIGDIEYTGTLTDISDRRLKDNITPLSDTGALLARLDQIDTYSFTMKDDVDKRTEFGVIAQDLERIFPELVHTADDDIKTKSVNYIGLIAPMIEATKELKARNEKLETELSQVKASQQDTNIALVYLTKQVALLNKGALQNVNKASMLPYLMLLFGLVFGIGSTIVINRYAKPS